MVGKAGTGKGPRIMRKVSILLFGVAVGALVVTAGSQTRHILGGTAIAAGSDTYRNLNLFGDV